MTNKEEIIEYLRKYFKISTAAFDMHSTIAETFGYPYTPSKMHSLHLQAKEELEKEDPDLAYIDQLLAEMEKTADENNTSGDGSPRDSPNFPKGGVFPGD